MSNEVKLSNILPYSFKNLFNILEITRTALEVREKNASSTEADAADDSNWLGFFAKSVKNVQFSLLSKIVHKNFFKTLFV